MTQPQVAGIAHPFSQPMGRPGDAEGQRAVQWALLEGAATASSPEAVMRLPFEWPAGVRPRQSPRTPPPILGLIKSKPWPRLKLRSGDIPDHA